MEWGKMGILKLIPFQFNFDNGNPSLSRIHIRRLALDARYLIFGIWCDAEFGVLWGGGNKPEKESESCIASESELARHPDIRLERTDNRPNNTQHILYWECFVFCTEYRKYNASFIIWFLSTVYSSSLLWIRIRIWLKTAGSTSNYQQPTFNVSKWGWWWWWWCFMRVKVK